MRIEILEQRPVRITQITDPHLGELEHTPLLGVDTDMSLEQVLGEVGQRPAADLILCTGDLSNDGSNSAYHRFKDKISTLNTPQVWLPGNHDERVQMADSLGADSLLLSREIHIGQWTILMLDSSVSAEVEGRLSADEIAFVADALQRNSNRHIMVCLHHHVLPVNCAWLDPQRIDNADEFLALLAAHQNVKVVLSGHVHQDFRANYAHFELITTPSTCIQFAPNCQDFTLDTKAPGYRWFDLYDNGHYETDVERVEAYALEADMAATGY